MKHIELLILFIIPAHFLMAQNVVFVSFEKKGKYDTVKQFLDSNSATEITHAKENLKIEADYLGADLRYDFYSGSLYRVSMKKTYENRKNGKGPGREAVNGIMEYFKTIKAHTIKSYHAGDTDYSAVVSQGRVLELTVVENALNEIEITLSATYAPSAPNHEESELTFAAKDYLYQEEVEFQSKREAHIARLQEVQLENMSLGGFSSDENMEGDAPLSMPIFPEEESEEESKTETDMASPLNPYEEIQAMESSPKSE